VNPHFTRRRYRISSWVLRFEALLFLAIAAIAKRLLPFRMFSRVMGSSVDRQTAGVIPPQMRSDLVWSFRLVRNLSYLRPLCLTEVMALSLMLRRRGLRGASFLGVAQKAPFQAHAWMRCGDMILPRAQDLTPYRVIAIFEPPELNP